MLRAASLTTFEIFEVGRGQKKALLRALKFFFDVFPEINVVLWFYLLTSLTGKPFFPMRNACSYRHRHLIVLCYEIE